MEITQVAPHPGAWIETDMQENDITITGVSHPTRVRGLKRIWETAEIQSIASHPTRVRGLKLHGTDPAPPEQQVAPHPGAWIETSPCWATSANARVAPHPGAWIETILYDPVYQPYAVAPHPGAWIETTAQNDYLKSLVPVAPHPGAWIETCS